MPNTELLYSTAFSFHEVLNALLNYKGFGQNNSDYITWCKDPKIKGEYKCNSDGSIVLKIYKEIS